MSLLGHATAEVSLLRRAVPADRAERLRKAFAGVGSG
ncbi:hypothetical protein QF037_000007 [Streptomyces canus]|nr:hypothetical protein [Streptomyces canus]